MLDYAVSFRLVHSHYGYLPNQRKQAYVVVAGDDPQPTGAVVLDALPERSSVHAVETRLTSISPHRAECPVVAAQPVEPFASPDPLGVVAVLDFSSVTKPGLYQIYAGGRRSHPFFIRADLYARTAYEAFRYSYTQRCGYAVPGVHEACHCDDALLPDGSHRDVTGGWHDAGDLRKWVNHTLWQAIGICWYARAAAPEVTPELLDELRWGNRFFLSMQDEATGEVWYAVGGDESDNVWTDSTAGVSGDERSIDTRVVPHVQFIFSWVQRMIAARFVSVDADYAVRCTDAADAAWRAGLTLVDPAAADTLTLSAAVLAAPEAAMPPLLAALLDRQFTTGPFPGAFADRPPLPEPPAAVFCDWWQHALLGWALFDASERLRPSERTLADRALCAVERYLRDHVARPAGVSAFGYPPVLVAPSPSTWDRYRELPGGGVGRFFLPCRSSRETADRFVGYGQGTNTALLGYASLLARGASVFDEPAYRRLALQALEWIHGANPLGVCMVTGRSSGEPYPHSRYVGLIPGAVMNGITGTAADEPHFGSDPYDLEWQTKEYWSPQQAQYLMTLVELGETAHPPAVGLA